MCKHISSSNSRTNIVRSNRKNNCVNDILWKQPYVITEKIKTCWNPLFTLIFVQPTRTKSKGRRKSYLSLTKQQVKLNGSTTNRFLSVINFRYYKNCQIMKRMHWGKVIKKRKKSDKINDRTFFVCEHSEDSLQSHANSCKKRT